MPKKRNVFVNIIRWIGIVVGSILLLALLLIAYWVIRPNRAQINPAVEMENWVAVGDGTHNSNTDLIEWNGAFYLIHATSPWHFASEDSRLIVRRSVDGHTWEPIAELDAAGEDIRDPKLALIGGRLFLYALQNTDFTAEPYLTVYSTSADGKTWSDFEPMQPEGWLFWRPKTYDGETWYLPAYWHEHGKSALLKSTDGVNWEIVTIIYEGERNDETAIEFLPDGTMICTARLEGTGSYFGDPTSGTLIGTAAPPYTDWSFSRSSVTRMDGPTLFEYNGQIYAAARYQPEPRGGLTELGGIFSRKRTALFRVDPDGLVYITDFPSSGDTSYTGVVIRGDEAYISYYTNNVKRDPAWVLGMVLASDIRIAKVDLSSMEAAAGQGGN